MRSSIKFIQQEMTTESVASKLLATQITELSANKISEDTSFQQSLRELKEKYQT